MMKETKWLLITLCILAVMIFAGAPYAQIGIIWSTESSCFAYLGSANMDGDPNEELVYFNPGPDQIVIFDGLTGAVDWTSGIWEYIGIAGYMGSDSILRGYSPFCDINSDGIKEITFRGQLYAGAPYTIYVVGMGGSGISPGGGNAAPGIHILSQNYPNPFNPSTTIQYSLSDPGEVTITIYNSLGQQVRTLLNGFRQPGEYEINWDGKDQYGHSVSSGTYYYQMQVGDYLTAKKAILLK